MSTGLHLGEFANTPLYNIKAVVQATGISPSTLRAWERRYNIARPERSESGYRLYSERDIAVIRWLKAQVDAGMSIRQAVTWLGNITGEAGEIDQAILPTTGSSATHHDPLGAMSDPEKEKHHEEVRDFHTLQQELIRSLTHFDEEGAGFAIAQAFAIYPIEQVGDRLFMPVLLEIWQRRQHGEVSITTQHFANNYLVHRLGALLRSTPNATNGLLIWVGCASTELHEAGALLLSIYLRRSGYQVHYLGHNVPVEEQAVKDLVAEARRHQPALILFSATTTPAAERLGQLASRLAQVNHLPAIIGYSGSIYIRNAELRAATAGVYLGTRAEEVLHNVDALLADRRRAERKTARRPFHKDESMRSSLPNAI